MSPDRVSVVMGRKETRRKGPALGVREACFATFLLCDPEQVTVPLWASNTLPFSCPSLQMP